MDLQDLPDFISEKADLRTFLVSASVLFLVLLGVFYSDYVILAVLVFLSLGGALAARFFRITTVGVEFTTFAVVVTGLGFGPVAGAVLASLLITFQMFGGGHKGAYILWVIPTFVVAGFIAGTLAFGPLASALVVLGFIHVVCTALTAFVTPENIPVYLTYAAGNTVLNLVLFMTLLEPVVQSI